MEILTPDLWLAPAKNQYELNVPINLHHQGSQHDLIRSKAEDLICELADRPWLLIA